MSLILMSNQRGTSLFYSDGVSDRRFEKKNQVTQFSYYREGKKISINRGTKSIWITKKPFLGIPYENKVIIVNRGTRRLEI